MSKIVDSEFEQQKLEIRAEAAAERARLDSITTLKGALTHVTGNGHSRLIHCWRVDLIFGEDVVVRPSYIVEIMRAIEASGATYAGMNTIKDDDLDGDCTGDHPNRGITRLQIDFEVGPEPHLTGGNVEWDAKHAAAEDDVLGFLALMDFEVGEEWDDNGVRKMLAPNGRWVTKILN